MSHLDRTNSEINHIETQAKTKEALPKMQLRMLYVIARLLACVLDRWRK